MWSCSIGISWGWGERRQEVITDMPFTHSTLSCLRCALLGGKLRLTRLAQLVLKRFYDGSYFLQISAAEVWSPCCCVCACQAPVSSRLAPDAFFLVMYTTVNWVISFSYACLIKHSPLCQSISLKLDHPKIRLRSGCMEIENIPSCVSKPCTNCCCESWILPSNISMIHLRNLSTIIWVFCSWKPRCYCRWNQEKIELPPHIFR